MNEKKRKNTKRSLYILMMVALIVLVTKLIWNWGDTSTAIGTLFGVVFPFILGWFIAYLINPLVDLLNKNVFKKLFRIKKKNVSRALSVLFAYVLVISLITTCMFYIIPQIVESLSQVGVLVDSAQSGYKKIVNFISDLNNQYPQWKLQTVINFIDKIPEYIENYIGDFILTVIPTIYSTSMSLITAVLDLIIALIVSVYMLFDKAKLINKVKKCIYVIMPEEKADRLIIVSAQCNKIFGNFIIGKMIDSIIIGCLCGIIMTIADLPYALVISVIVGVTNMIPYFGPFIGAIPGILLLLIVDFYYAILFTIIIIILQQFDGLYLGPKILGESTGLRPIWIIFAITVGGSVAGVAGMFLGVPVTAVVAYLLNECLDKRLKRKNIEFEVDEETGIISKDTLIKEDKSIQ